MSEQGRIKFKFDPYIQPNQSKFKIQGRFLPNQPFFSFLLLVGKEPLAFDHQIVLKQRLLLVWVWMSLNFHFPILVCQPSSHPSPSVRQVLCVHVCMCVSSLASSLAKTLPLLLLLLAHGPWALRSLPWLFLSPGASCQKKKTMHLQKAVQLNQFLHHSPIVC